MQKLLPLLLSGLLLACSGDQDVGNHQADNQEARNPQVRIPEEGGEKVPAHVPHGQAAPLQAPNLQAAAVPVEEELVREKAEAFLKEKLGNPAGFVFISLSAIDTVTFIDNINYLKNQQKDKPRIVAKIDSIAKGLGERVNDPAAYTYMIRFRTKNGQGAEVQNEWMLQVGPAPNYKILHMAADDEGLSLSPNDFPGYKEIFVKSNKGGN
jgi:hypothetical protein